MIVVLSPAKKLHEGPAIDALPRTQPPLLSEAAALAREVKDLTADDLADLMGISAKLASLNAHRFARWSAEPAAEEARQAARMFAGDTYQGLDAASLSDEDLSWAQDHLLILSGLYGVVRPLDLIAPYRLEMGTAFETSRGRDLYAYWGDRIAREIKRRLADQPHPVLVNCASQEYFKAVDLDALGARVITPRFEEAAGGQSKVISFYAKRARGRMARFAVTHRCRHPDQLLAFAEDGYRYVPDDSTPNRPVFRRPKPPPKRASSR